MDSFSDIEILAAANAEEHGTISYTDGSLKVSVEKNGTYTLVLARYSGDRMSALKVLTPELQKGENTIGASQLDGFELTAGTRIFLWENLTTLKPICGEYAVSAE